MLQYICLNRFYHVLPREDSCSHIWNEGASALSLTAAEQGDSSTTLTGSNIQGLLRPSAQINGPFGLCNVSKTQAKTSFYCDVTSFLLKRTENVLVSYPLSSLETIETTLGTCLAQSQDSPAQLSSEENIPLNLWVFYIKPDATADNGQLTTDWQLSGGTSQEAST